MSRKKTTIYLEEDLVRAARILAARTGKHEYEVFEAALRRYLGLEVLENVWHRAGLSEEDALNLAYQEVHAARG